MGCVFKSSSTEEAKARIQSKEEDIIVVVDNRHIDDLSFGEMFWYSPLKTKIKMVVISGQCVANLMIVAVEAGLSFYCVTTALNDLAKRRETRSKRDVEREPLLEGVELRVNSLPLIE